jgi:hypothetical protein
MHMERPFPARPVAHSAAGVAGIVLLLVSQFGPAQAATQQQQPAANAASAAMATAGGGDAYDPDTDPALLDKSCQRDDPCMRTKARWVSPRRMKDRFDAGVLNNSNKVLLPLRIRKLATKRWNEDHGVVASAIDVGKKGDVWDCDGHWWCKPLDVGSCVVSIFLCAAQNIGWDETRAITLDCGGLAIIGGRIALETSGPDGVFWAAAGTATGCVYESLGEHWGWWSFP